MCQTLKIWVYIHTMNISMHHRGRGMYIWAGGRITLSHSICTLGDRTRLSRGVEREYAWESSHLCTRGCRVMWIGEYVMTGGGGGGGSISIDKNICS